MIFFVVLWLMPEHKIAKALMHRISRRMKEAKMKEKPVDTVQLSLLHRLIPKPITKQILTAEAIANTSPQAIC